MGNPEKHLAAVERDYPHVWAGYEHFLSIRADLGGWPDWCYCPMAAAYAIVSGGGDSTVPPERTADIARVAALGAWRDGKAVRTLSEGEAEALLDVDASTVVLGEQLYSLPHGLYIDVAGHYGFFAHLEYDPSDGRGELRLLIDEPGRELWALPIHLGGTLSQGVGGFVAHAALQAARPLSASVLGAAEQAARRLVPIVLAQLG